MLATVADCAAVALADAGAAAAVVAFSVTFEASITAFAVKDCGYAEPINKFGCVWPPAGSKLVTLRSEGYRHFYTYFV